MPRRTAGNADKYEGAAMKALIRVTAAGLLFAPLAWAAVSPQDAAPAARATAAMTTGW